MNISERIIANNFIINFFYQKQKLNNITAEKCKHATFHMSASKRAHFSHSLSLLENAARNAFTCSRETAVRKEFVRPWPLTFQEVEGHS